MSRCKVLAAVFTGLALLVQAGPVSAQYEPRVILPPPPQQQPPALTPPTAPQLTGPGLQAPHAPMPAPQPAAPARPEVCTEQYVPVCGEKNGARRTYSNACFAAVDGARVVADGPCP